MDWAAYVVSGLAPDVREENRGLQELESTLTRATVASYVPPDSWRITRLRDQVSEYRLSSRFVPQSPSFERELPVKSFPAELCLVHRLAPEKPRQRGGDDGGE